MLRRSAVAALLAGCLALPTRADAFCGFFVGTVGTTLINRATTVVLMRDGTHTVLSMRSDYDGPPENFALVVPVPVVLRRRDVQTLPHDVFDRIDEISAPRLVESWERDPCEGSSGYTVDGANVTSPAFGMYTIDDPRGVRGHGVEVEARFAAGEYDVEILGARDSLGLVAWLRAHDYRLPAGAEAALRPYVQDGMKFFVAKVAIDRVRREPDGRVTLSPLRFHYDSERFSLPVRLGLLNAAGPQDLIVHVLARQRYQAANRPNVAIPTNVDVVDATRGAFAQFYAALFDRTVRDAPGAVVTEYAWGSQRCDPCPGPTLDRVALATFGGDILWGKTGSRTLPLSPDTAPTGAVSLPDDDPFQPTESRAILERDRPRGKAPPSRWPREVVHTRLHLRYAPDSPGEDLVLQATTGLTGGNEGDSPSPGRRPTRESGRHQFQARYVIRHAWSGPVPCTNPRRGRWGGPPVGVARPAPAIATDLAFAPRDADLSTFLLTKAGEAGELPAPTPLRDAPEPPPPISSRSTHCDAGSTDEGMLALLACLALRRRRRAVNC